MRSRFNRRLDMQTRYKKARHRSLADSSPGIHDCIFILDGLKPDFNIGKIFRSGDAFGIREIHLTGVEYFDPEPAKGSMRWVRYHLHENFQQCYSQLAGLGYSFMTLEPEVPDQLGKTDLPLKAAFIMGHEEFGISFDITDYPEIKRLSIPQWGKVQSLNVSVAASIVMYEYTRQHGQPMVEKAPAQGHGNY